MKIDAIVVDANLIVKKYNTFISGLSKVIQVKDFFNIELCLPKVVYDECLGNYNNDIKECDALLIDAVNKYQKTLIDIYRTKVDIEKIMNDFKGKGVFFDIKLNKFIEDNNVKIIDYPEVSHSEVVSSIYEGKVPFGNKNSEQGYKDFLIICSIREYQRKNKKGDVILYTNNIKDFSGGMSGDVNVINMTDEGDSKIYVVSDVKKIIDLITNSMKKTDFNDVFSSFDDFNDTLGKAIVSNVMFFDTLYGSIYFEAINVRDSVFSTSDVVVEINNEFLTLRGRCKIYFRCDFKMNSFEYDAIDSDFIFHEVMTKALKSSGSLEKEFWEYTFFDYTCSKTVEFEYVDFEYKPEKYKNEIKLDDAMLSINNID